MEWLQSPRNIEFSEQRHRYHSLLTQQTYLNAFNHENDHIWEISRYHNGYDQPIGTITALRDSHNGVAEIGILIGELACRGRGYGQEAWMAVQDWLFAVGTRKVEAGTMYGNTAMIKIFYAAGMSLEGCRRAHFLKNGIPTDMVLYGRNDGRVRL